MQDSTLRKAERERTTPVWVFLAAFAILILSIGFLRSSMPDLFTTSGFAPVTGLFLEEGGVTQQEQLINQTLSMGASLAFSIQNPPENFHLRSLAISGNYVGNGSFKVFLQDAEGVRYLVVDSALLGVKGIKGITGMAVANVKKKDKEKSDDKNETPAADEALPLSVTGAVVAETVAEASAEIANATVTEAAEDAVASPLENETLSAQDVPATETPAVEPAPAVENETSLAPQDPTMQSATESITLSVQYLNGTEHDPDDDGIEGDTGVVDLSVASSTIPSALERDRLCALWQVESLDTEERLQVCHGADDCCALATLKPQQVRWDHPLELYDGRYGATERNVVSAALIYANYTLSGEGHADVQQTEWQNLSVSFVPGFVRFTDACVDTCLLPPGLQGKDYSLIVETEGDGMLHLARAALGIKEAGPGDIVVGKLEDDPDYNVTVNRMYKNKDKLVIELFHNGPRSLPIELDGDITYSVINSRPGTREPATIIIYDYEDQYFRIKVGEHSEVLAFGKPKTITLKTAVKDATGDIVDGNLSIVDTLLDKVVVSADNLSLDAKIKEGTYRVQVMPENNPIDLITFEGVKLFKNTSATVGVEAPDLAAVQSYAIDPTKIKFKNATVTVTARGSKLYKCKNWDFKAEECGGDWKLVRDDLVPGQNYTFDLGPSDPAWTERLDFDNCGCASVQEKSPTVSNCTAVCPITLSVPPGATEGHLSGVRFAATVDIYYNPSGGVVAGSGVHNITLDMDNTPNANDIVLSTLASDSDVSFNITNASISKAVLNKTTCSEWALGQCVVYLKVRSKILSSSDTKKASTAINISDGSTSLLSALNYTWDFNQTTNTSQLSVDAQDSAGRDLTLSIVVEDLYDNDTVEVGQKKKQHLKDIRQGKKRVLVKPQGNKIREIRYDRLDLDKDINISLGIDTLDVDNLSKPAALANKSWAAAYALDPKGFNETNATVTVTATGTELHKCAAWNFTTQTCPSGGWALLLSNLTPGQNYSFTLGPSDPGFAETVNGSNTTVAPTINAVSETPRDWNASVSWSVTKSANGTIDYGLTAALGMRILSEQLSDWHLVAITNLTPNTTVYYNVTSCADSLCSVAGPFMFMTDPDTAPPGDILGVTAVRGYTNITWIWTNPSNLDFNHTEIYVNGVWTINTTLTSYTLTGIVPASTHSIRLVAIDHLGNRANNTLAAHAAQQHVMQLAQQNMQNWGSYSAGAPIHMNLGLNATLPLEWCGMYVDGVYAKRMYNITPGDLSLSYNLTPGLHNWTMYCKDIYNETVWADTYWVNMRNLTLSKFDGLTTSLENTTLDAVPNFTIEKAGYGMLRFMNEVNLSGDFDLDKHIEVSSNFARVNSTALSALNTTATITLYNVSLTNAVVRYDPLDNGTFVDCPLDVCTNVTYNETAQTLTFTVAHFTSFAGGEASPADPRPIVFEASSSDAGASSSEISSDSTEAPSEEEATPAATTEVTVVDLDAQPPCRPSWSCREWSACEGNQQSRNCVDVNSCGGTAGLSETHRSCVKQCTPEWKCGEWSACSFGVRSRQCSDAHSCPIKSGAPAQQEACGVLGVSINRITGDAAAIISSYGLSVEYLPAALLGLFALLRFLILCRRSHRLSGTRFSAGAGALVSASISGLAISLIVGKRAVLEGLTGAVSLPFPVESINLPLSLAIAVIALPVLGGFLAVLFHHRAQK